MVHITKGELTQEEKELLEVIGKGTVQEAGTLLASKNVRVNCLDELRLYSEILIAIPTRATPNLEIHHPCRARYLPIQSLELRR